MCNINMDESKVCFQALLEKNALRKTAMAEKTVKSHSNELRSCL